MAEAKAYSAYTKIIDSWPGMNHIMRGERLYVVKGGSREFVICYG